MFPEKSRPLSELLKYTTENVLSLDKRWTRRTLLPTAALNKCCH